MMKLRLFTFLFLLACIHANAQRPNIVFIIGDDISADDFGCYGNPYIKTPNVDDIAKNGIKFTNMYLTISSCSPSRASILTGRYPHNTGAAELHSPIPDNQILFPKLLKEAGYYTAQSGKWHLGASPIGAEGMAKNAFDRVGGGVSKTGGIKSGAEEWVTTLRERPKDKPFFMWFAANDAHEPWEEKEYTEQYKAEDILTVPVFFPDNLESRKKLVPFYGEISRLDSYVGEVKKELEAQGILDNTIFIFMTDNGRPQAFHKTFLVPGGLKTPFVVTWPKGFKGAGLVSNSLISSIDIAPTLLEACGVTPNEEIQGKSFLSLLQEPNKPFRNYVFGEHNWHGFTAYERMVCNDKYLYIETGALTGIHHSKGGPIDSMFRLPKKLFDLTKDPHCSKNVFGNKEYASISGKLAKTLKTWKKQTGDYQPENLTKDGYGDKNATGHSNTRGEMPGFRTNAKSINRRGPF